MDELVNQRYLKIFATILLILFLFVLFFNDLVVNFFLTYLVLYKYTTLFVIVFLAGLCIPIPNNVLLTAVGALALQGDFNFILALITATVANFAGDMAALFIFRKYGHSILRDRYAQKYSFFVRLEKFFQDHVNVSIFISRILGIFGTPVNFLSGYLKISPWRFAIFDIIGNFVFAFIFLKIGFVMGERWVAVSDLVNTVMTVFAAIILIFIFSVLFMNREKE